MTTYDFKNFSYCDVDIIIPEDTYFCRGIDVITTEIIRDMPIYIGPEYIAKEYGKVYYLKTKSTLKLIDIRKLMHLMKLIIASRKTNNATIKNSISYITMAFGLCSYDKQIKLLEEFSEYIKTYSNSKESLDYFNYCVKNMKEIDPSNKLNPIEPEGVRVAETYIDGFVITILKELFNGIYDGFIAPKLISTFHKDNQTHEEIVIFDPKNKLEVSPIDIKLEIKPIDDIIKKYYKKYELKSNELRMFIIKHGGFKEIFFDKNKFFDDKKLCEKAQKIADKFKNEVNFEEYIFKIPKFNIFGELQLPEKYRIPL